jgi:gluconokinase
LKRSLILGLDIGTSSVRASLYDDAATVIPASTAKVEQSFINTSDGASEIDADQAFDNVVLAIDTALAKTEAQEGEIELVASCSFWHSLVGVDLNGTPTTKLIGWADTRSRKYTEVLRKAFDESEMHNRTGARFHSSYWPAKLLWLRAEHPEEFARTDKWISFCDLVALRLYGESSTSVSMASGTGVFDIRSCTWDPDLLKFLGVDPSRLPTIAESDASVFNLNETFAQRWPSLADAKWSRAIADGAADNIGSGCVTRNRAALMIGTSGAMRVAWEGEPPEEIPAGLWCYRIDRRRVVMGGALSDGGGLYRWLRSNLKLPDDAESQIAKRPPGSRGLAFLPFLSGERSTGYNEDATGAILGLTAGHDSVDILQAAMESVAFRFADILDQLSEVVSVDEIVASGGALRDSPVWTQIIADVLGRDLMISDADESSSRGAVLHALESKGKIVDINTKPSSGTRLIRADPIRSKAFSETRKAHVSFYEQLIQREPNK